MRYQLVLLRDRFEQTRKIKDMRVLAVMVAEGEKELAYNRHLQPSIFANDYDGITHHQFALPYDQLMDQWHPWEKVTTKILSNTRGRSRGLTLSTLPYL